MVQQAPFYFLNASMGNQSELNVCVCVYIRSREVTTIFFFFQISD